MNEAKPESKENIMNVGQLREYLSNFSDEDTVGVWSWCREEGMEGDEDGERIHVPQISIGHAPRCVETSEHGRVAIVGNFDNSLSYRASKVLPSKEAKPESKEKCV